MRLIAVDVDGTLLGSDGRISRRTTAALDEARRRGVYVVVATGRPAVFAQRVLRDLPAATHLVSANGAEVATASGEVLHRLAMDRPRATALVERLRVDVPGIGFSLITEHEAVYEPGFEQLLPHAMIPGRRVRDVLTAVGREAHRVCAFHAALGAHGLLAVIPSPLPDGTVVTHGGIDAVDLLPSAADKATGLALLAERLGIEAAQVVAFGDQRNDHGMLRWAGLGVAMGNADDETKGHADEISASNDDDGIAIVVERLLDG
jgi:hypothetical protein